MTIYEKIKSMDIEKLTDWIDKYGQFDDSPWMEWFDKTYCKNCEHRFTKMEREDYGR